jgi:hypothetical protein
VLPTVIAVQQMFDVPFAASVSWFFNSQHTNWQPVFFLDGF